MINNFNDHDYKFLSVPITTNISDEEVSNLKSIFDAFKRSDVFLDHDQLRNELLIYAKEVDLSDFDKAFKILDNDVEEFYLKAIYKMISDIGSYGLKDRKRVFVGYNKERKVINRKEKELQRSKHYYANNNDFSSTNNQIPDNFVNKIICDDSEKVLKQLPDNCVDIMFTSPPYNFGLDYENHKDENYWEEYFSKLFVIFDEVIRVLKFGGRFVINIQPLFSDYIPTHHVISSYLMGKKLIWKGEILWEKNNYNCKYTAWGSYQSPSSPYLKYTWEFVEVFTKGTLLKKGERKNIDITAEEFKNWVVAKWSIAPERHMKKFNHPAMFPEELAKRVLKLFSYTGDIVLDPFMGAGTTCLVAKKYNRKYLGIDISQEYCDISQRRVDEILL